MEETKESLMQVAEVELMWKKKKKLTTKIKESKEAVEVFRTVWHQDINIRERVYVLFMNRVNNVIAVSEISAGGVSGTVIDTKILFAQALKLLASGIILAHNHPSGNLNPSGHDKDITTKVKKGCEVFDMVLIDHVILTEDDHYSFANEGSL